MHNDDILQEEVLPVQEEGVTPATQEQELAIPEVTEEIQEEIPAVIAEEQPEEISQEPAEEIAEEQPEEATEEQSEETTEDTAEEQPEETTEEATEKTTEEATEETASAPQVPEKVPYHERYYLKYREGKRTQPQELAGTRAFLQALGFDGGELRQAREGKNRAEELRNGEPAKGNQMRCSYCGVEVSGVEFNRMPDGRIRCTTCDNTVVKTKAEVEELCQRVLNNLDNFFGATIDVPIDIEVVDERKLKKKVGIGTRDTQSMLILGVAINKKKKFNIILENGAPRISLIATFAHELTHIWQYTHWDNKKGFPKCPKDKRLLIYEGMAKWVEIQYLYLIGENTVARREEFITRNREDPYGIGFCMYEDRYPLSREAMSCEETPFTTNQYPLD